MLEQGLAIAETTGLLQRFNGARVESRASVCFQSFPGDSPMQAELKPTDTTSSRSAVIHKHLCSLVLPSAGGPLV